MGTGTVVGGPALGLRTGGAVTGVCRAAVCNWERLWLGAERRSSAMPTAATATATAAAVSTTPVIDGRRPKWRVARRSLSRRGEPPPSLADLPRAGDRSSNWKTCGWTTGTGLVGSPDSPGSASPFSPNMSGCGGKPGKVASAGSWPGSGAVRRASRPPPRSTWAPGERPRLAEVATASIAASEGAVREGRRKGEGLTPPGDERAREEAGPRRWQVRSGR